MLVSIAAKKPSRLKLNSVAEHNANPIMMGNSDKLTNIPVFSPMIQLRNLIYLI